MSFIKAVRGDEPPRPIHDIPLPAGQWDATPRAAAALAREVTNIQHAAEGTRNHTLNVAAFNLGQLIAAGEIAEPAVTQAIGDAALMAGLDIREIRATIRSGYAKGTLKPRTPNKPSVPPAPHPVPGGTDTPTHDIPQAIDWDELWTRPDNDEWLLEPLIAPGRQTVIYSPAKVGKSLLALQIAVAIANGRPTLGVPTAATPVLYIDFENDPVHDLRSRLVEMGLGPADLGNLTYLSYPTIHPMDTPAGAAHMERILDHYSPGLVVIDTISRAVQGEENSNDTWTALYRLTGLVLKRKGISLLRLDHSGKDETKGQRGGSAKTGDVDAVWRMHEVVRDEAYRLDCELKRMHVDQTTIDLRRTFDPLGHQVTTEHAGQAKERAILKLLDDAGLPLDVGRPTASDLVRAAGIRVRNATLASILKKRQGALGDYE